VLEVVYHHAIASLVGLGFHQPPGWPKTLSFFLFVRHAFKRERLCARLCMKALEYKNDFDAAGHGNIYFCATEFNFLRLLPTGNITKMPKSKNGKIWGFRPQRATE